MKKLNSDPSSRNPTPFRRLLGRASTSALAAGLVISFAVAAWAGPATDLVRERQSELFSLIAQPKSGARQKKLKALFDTMLDYDTFARESLGDEWEKRTAAEKAEFTGLLTQLIQNNYRRNLNRLLNYEIKYLPEESKKGGTLVNTEAHHKTNAREDEIEIDFLLRDVNGKPKVVDIVTEEASMVRTYRSQFRKIIRKKGFDKLIKKMKKKLAKQKKKG